MIKLFGTANEKYLRAVTVYYNSTDSIVYYKYDSTADTPYTEPVSKKDLINLFKKGILVVDTGSEFVRPTVLTIDDDYAAVSHTVITTVTVQEVESEVPAIATYYSEGYEAS